MQYRIVDSSYSCTAILKLQEVTTCLKHLHDFSFNQERNPVGVDFFGISIKSLRDVN